MPAEYNFILAGKYGVGKSSLFTRLKTGDVPDGVTEGTSRSTRTWGDDDGGLDSFVYEREIDGKKIRVTLWDTGGQERYESMTANYYRNAHAVIFVYAVDEEGTLYALNEVVSEAKEMSRQGERLVLALWGSKADLPGYMHTVKEDAVDAFLNTYRIPEHLNYKVSALDGSVEKAMLALIEHVDKQFIHQEPTQEQENRDLSKFHLPSSSAATTPSSTCCRSHS